MFSDELKARTRRFALQILELADQVPWSYANGVLIKQFVRSGTAVGANYRAASKAKSGDDFAYKIKRVEEEADESVYWLDLLVTSKRCSSPPAVAALAEANELAALFASVSITLRRRRRPNS